jgi:ubiquinone/menaquinone biosynthesis C-methylase UbiE
VRHESILLLPPVPARSSQGRSRFVDTRLADGHSVVFKSPHAAVSSAKVDDDAQRQITDDGATAAAEYDAMAAAYDAHNQTSAANAYYERPATIALLGDVRGQRVLEVGCGSGRLTQWLVDRGASVVAFDISAGMLAIARGRVGDRAELHRAHLGEPLDFVDDDSIDLVVASLVMHYVRDWKPPLCEFRRVVRDSGAAVISIHHPAWDWRNHCPEDYFAFLQVSEVWVPPHPVTFWRRPLTMVTQAIAVGGFVIERMEEAQPDPALAEIDPDAYRELMTSPFFLHLRLRPVQADGSVAPRSQGAGIRPQTR